MSPIYPKFEESDWEDPPEGTHQGVIYDLGFKEGVEVEYDGKKSVIDQLIYKVEFNPETAGQTSEKKNFMLTKKANNNATGERSGNRLFVEGIRGKKFKDGAEFSRFDCESLVRDKMNGLFNVVYVESKTTGKTYARIDNVIPLPKGMKPMEPTNPPREMNERNGIKTDSDLPF